jgi:signal transduction histidine kinase
VALSGLDRDLQILLFAQGQAGIVTGHFGFIRRIEPRRSAALVPTDTGPDAALLTRISRGVRRPLNTVIGFADLIGSAAFGPLENPRYQEYARDIRTAGEEIAALVDELDDYSRLKDGRYQPAPADIDLAALLEASILRIRPQANAARVLVRSAVSERLPRIIADRASLTQGLLNLLASAVDQTPPAGSVVLSAQSDEDGGIVVHVRDGAAVDADLGERFVVFRDGIGRNGTALTPVRSSVGLALTRSLFSVNACSLSVGPAGGSGTLLSLRIPEDLVLRD